MDLKTVRAAFERGDLEPILAATLGRDDVRYPVTWARFVIGAAALLGKIDEAVTLFGRDIARRGFTVDDQVAAKFYLAIGLIRVSRYQEAIRYVAQNLRAVTEGALVGEGRFFAFQGLAFYRYFQCRYLPALNAARKAYAAALPIGYAYGLAISRDLIAHAQCSLGEISIALASWGDALARAERLGLGGLAENIKSSLASARASAGLDGKETLKRLESTVRNIAPQDNFSRAGAEIELARQLTLLGDLDRSTALLESAATIVMKAGHRRQRAQLLHRLAYNCYLAGDLTASDARLSEAETVIDPSYDLQHVLMIAGLRRRVARARGVGRFDERDDDIRRLTLKTQTGVARNIFWREFGMGTPTVPGDDPIGDIKHRTARCFRATSADLAAVITSGLMGLIPEMLPLPLGTRAVCLGVVPGRVVLLDRGNIAVSRERVSDVMKRLAIALSMGVRSKRELVEMLWGYSYHPMRHDPLIYALAGRMRKAIAARPACKDWLVATSGGYAWDEGVRLYIHEVEQFARVPPKVAKTAQPESAPVLDDVELNWRQVAILSELKTEKALGPADAVTLFGISRITASRDFADLHERGLVRRMGKGRGTRYSLRTEA